MAEEIDSKSNRFAEQFRQRIIESAALIVSAVSLLISVLCMIVVVVSLVIALQATRDNKILQEKHDVTQIYVRDLKAHMIEQGFKPPEED